MADPTPSCAIPCKRNLIQLNKRTISTSYNSIVIRKGANANKIKEKQIFSKSKIHFLISIGEKNYKKAFSLALSSKRIALFQLKKESPIAIFKLDEKIADHGTVEVLDMGRREEGEFRVKLTIPIAFYSGTLRKIRLTVHFSDSQITKQKMKCLEEMRMENEKMKFCVDLGNDNFFGFYEDTVVKSDGLVTRAEEPSTKKRKRIAVVGRELWHGNILLATENGTIRVVRVTEGIKKESDDLLSFSEGQCVPPYCTLRCREPSVIISSENTVIVGTQRGEIHFLNEQFELRCKIDTEGGPISCLKVDENVADFLWVGFENGELRMLFMPDSEQNVIWDVAVDEMSNEEEVKEDVNSDPKSLRNCDTPVKHYGKRSETELECLEMGCGFKTRVASTFISHLRAKHRTIPSLAGIALRCQCGIETVSKYHSQTCNISNFTVVRKNDFGPIRTLLDKKMTPQCTLCEMYPRTVLGYAMHVAREHGKSLSQVGCYLNCGVCGVDFYDYNHMALRNHPKKCKSRFYSLHKLSEKEGKKDETEMDQTDDA